MKKRSISILALSAFLSISMTGIGFQRVHAAEDISPTIIMNDVEYSDPVEPVVEGNPGNGEVTFHYFVYSSYNGQYAAISYTPQAIGTYQVYADVAASGEYNAGTTPRVTFQIVKKKLKVPTVNPENYPFTGEWIYPHFDDFDENLVAFQGIMPMQGVGDSYGSFILKDSDKYCWEDGTIESKAATWHVVASPIKPEYISLDPDYFTYTGSAITPQPVIKVKEYDEFENGTDYTLSYENNIEVGTATVTVNMKEGKNLSGSASVTFRIIPQAILTISGVEDQQVQYTGQPVVLAGNMQVNGGPIAPEQLNEAWYDDEGNQIEKPTELGEYTVVYSYLDDGYFLADTAIHVEIIQKTSEFNQTQEIFGEAGKPLSSVSPPEHAQWVDPETTVEYWVQFPQITYTENGDSVHYTTETLDVIVVGLHKFQIHTSVDGTGGTITPTVSGIWEYDMDKIMAGIGLEASQTTIEFTPDICHVIEKVTLDGEEQAVTGNQLTVTALTGDACRDRYVVVAYQSSHTLAHHDALEATCTAEGNEEYWECSVCGKLFLDADASQETTLEEVTIAKKPHQYDSGLYEKDADGHWHVCTVCGTASPVESHHFGSWVHTGSHTRTCTDCGYSETEECTYGDWQVIREATDREPGSKQRICTKCGYAEIQILPVIERPDSTEPDPESDRPNTGVSDGILWEGWLLAAMAAGYGMIRIRKKQEE